MTITEQMKSLVNDLTTTRENRSAVVARFKKETEEILNNARASIRQTASDHQEMARKLQADLANHNKTRLKRARVLRNSVRRDLRESGVRIRETLEQTKADRKLHVAELLQSFQQARQLLAADIREAAEAWQLVHSEQPASGANENDHPASHKRKRHHHTRAGN